MIMIDRRRFALGFTGALAWPAIARAEVEIDVRPEFSARFSEAGTSGVCVVFRPRDNKLIVNDESRARLSYVPASTFKIPHALIALETGVVADGDQEVIRWDGQTRSIEAWNKDHTLRSAMAVSAVPVFQQIARRIGSDRMTRYLTAFGYGNRDIGAQIDRFWLDGPLKITALEQIAFLDRLRRGDLPLSQRSLDIGRDIIQAEAVSNGQMRFKTGAVGIDGTAGEKAALGWVVGYVDRGEDSSVFALNLDVKTPADLGRRLPIAKAIMSEVGAI